MKKKRKHSLNNVPGAFTSVSVDQPLTLLAMGGAGLFPALSCLASSLNILLTEAFDYPRSVPFWLGPCCTKIFSRPLETLLNQHVDGASIALQLSYWLTRFQLNFVHGSNESSCFPDHFRNEKMKCTCTSSSRAPATFSKFASIPRSHRAHGLSSMARSSLT